MMLHRRSRRSILLVLLVSGIMLLSTATPAAAGPFTTIDDVTVTDPDCTGNGLLHVTGFHDGVPIPPNYITAQAEGSDTEFSVDLPLLDLPGDYAIDIAYEPPPAPGIGFDVVVRLWGAIPIFDDILFETVVVSIPCPVPPVANDDAATTAHNAPVVINVAANDSDANGNLDPSSVSVTAQPASGTAISNGDGTVTYTPVLGGTGIFTFTYQICDTTNLCDSANVSVEVTNEPPVANDDAASTSINTAVVIDVAANDSGAPENDLVVSSVAVTVAPTNGSAVANGDGTVIYTPNPGFHDVDTFTYEICDSGGLCDTAVVTVTVATGGGGPGGVPDNPNQASEHANSHACEDNPGQANDHRPDNLPPCDD